MVQNIYVHTYTHVYTYTHVHTLSVWLSKYPVAFHVAMNKWVGKKGELKVFCISTEALLRRVWFVVSRKNIVPLPLVSTSAQNGARMFTLSTGKVVGVNSVKLSLKLMIPLVLTCVCKYIA